MTGILLDFFSGPQKKYIYIYAQKFRGKFRSIFRDKFRSSKKIIRANFVLQTCHPKTNSWKHFSGSAIVLVPTVGCFFGPEIPNPLQSATFVFIVVSSSLMHRFSVHFGEIVSACLGGSQMCTNKCAHPEGHLQFQRVCTTFARLSTTCLHRISDLHKVCGICHFAM